MHGVGVANTPAHLGGHQGETWIDEPVLDYLISTYHVRSMLDVGCGLGGMIDLARRKGVYAWGIDGDVHVARPDIVIHDFTVAPFVVPATVDLIWCVEFVEHVEAQYEDNYFATFDAGRVLYLTHAIPGQRGHHHVNEQYDYYWIERLERRGWTISPESTIWARVNGAMPFSRISGLVFTKECTTGPS